MSRSLFNWLVIYSDYSTETVVSTTVENVMVAIEGSTDDVISVLRQDLS